MPSRLTHLRMHSAEPAAAQRANAACCQRRLGQLGGQLAAKHSVAACDARAQLWRSHSRSSCLRAPLGASARDAVDMPPYSASEKVCTPGVSHEGCGVCEARKRVPSSGPAPGASRTRTACAPTAACCISLQRARQAGKFQPGERERQPARLTQARRLAPRSAKSFARPTTRRHITAARGPGALLQVEVAVRSRPGGVLVRAQASTVARVATRAAIQARTGSRV